MSPAAHSRGTYRKRQETWVKKTSEKEKRVSSFSVTWVSFRFWRPEELHPAASSAERRHLDDVRVVEHRFPAIPRAGGRTAPAPETKTKPPNRTSVRKNSEFSPNRAMRARKRRADRSGGAYLDEPSAMAGERGRRQCDRSPAWRRRERVEPCGGFGGRWLRGPQSAEGGETL